MKKALTYSDGALVERPEASSKSPLIKPGMMSHLVYTQDRMEN